jgi:hypothetical protein
MKVFISWSGERSRVIAETLRTWLPDVINFLDPWISSRDIDKGARWGADLVQQLAESHIGIICLTPENLNAPWILFEAGALSKALDKTRVCTYLFQLHPSDLEGPLVQFQATEATEQDTLRLLCTLNDGLGEHRRSDEQIHRAFATWWPGLKKVLSGIQEETATTPLRTDRALLEEMLDLLRSNTKHSSMTASKRRWLPDLSPLFEGNELELFAEGPQLEGGATDSNSSNWAVEAGERSNASALDGVWASRWNGTGLDNTWKYGHATLVCRGEFLVAVHSEDTTPHNTYVILARELATKRFLGRYFNLREPRDSTPWMGFVIDDCRIDGRWAWGRWDLRRYHDRNVEVQPHNTGAAPDVKRASRARHR